MEKHWTEEAGVSILCPWSKPLHPQPALPAGAALMQRLICVPFSDPLFVHEDKLCGQDSGQLIFWKPMGGRKDHLVLVFPCATVPVHLSTNST